MTINKVAEKLIAEITIEDMKASIDPSQYGNQPGLSTTHYLIKMIHKTSNDLDSTEITAVLATFIDWEDALPSQCPRLGIEALTNVTQVHFKLKHKRTLRLERLSIINMTKQLNNHMKKKQKLLNL